MTRFRATAIVSLGDNSIKTGTSKSGLDWTRVNISMSNTPNNRLFAESFGCKNPVIKTKDTEGNNIEINRADAKDPSVIDTVANYRTFSVNIDGDRRIFLDNFDMNEFIAENKDTINNGIYTVVGSVEPNVYNGEISPRFKVQNIYQADENVAKKIQVTMDLFFNGDSFDLADWKTDKKIYVDGYTSAFFDKNTLGTETGANRYIPQRVVLDCSKIDFENEKHVKILNMRLKLLGLKLEEDKIVIALDKKNMYHLPMICNYVNGAEEVPFDESMLTKLQKECIDAGLNTIDDFKPKGSVFGDRTIAYKISDFDLTGDFADGMVKCDENMKEFEELIYTVTKAVSVDELDGFINMPTGIDEDIEEDLFG